jgi:hypothetical protein
MKCSQLYLVINNNYTSTPFAGTLLPSCVPTLPQVDFQGASTNSRELHHYHTCPFSSITSIMYTSSDTSRIPMRAPALPQVDFHPSLRCCAMSRATLLVDDPTTQLHQNPSPRVRSVAPEVTTPLPQLLHLPRTQPRSQFRTPVYIAAPTGLSRRTLNSPCSPAGIGLGFGVLHSWARPSRAKGCAPWPR